MRNKKQNGFTLIELLAVIIVLAIIMVLTIPNVIKSMDKAKSKALIVYSKRALVEAQKKYQENDINNESQTIGFVSLKKVGLNDTGNYKGSILMMSNNLSYEIYITDGSKYICGETLSSLNSNDNKLVTTSPSIDCKEKVNAGYNYD